jgi:hypothetical protein
LAAAAVVALIFLVDQSSTTPSDNRPHVLADNHVEIKDKKPADVRINQPPVKDGGSTPNVKPPPIENKIPVFNPPNPTAAALAEFLQNNKSAKEIHVELAGDLDLRDFGTDKELVIANPIVKIRALGTKKRPTIYDHYRGGLTTALQASLTIASENCTMDGIRFVLDQNGSNVPMAALLFRGAKEPRIRLNRCEFIQADPYNKGESRITSVFVEARAGSLSLTESCFLGFETMSTANGDGGGLVFTGAATGGHDAITRRGAVRIEARHCLFGPHAATFRLEGAAPESKRLVALEHCSVLAANQSAVFDVMRGADADIRADFSLFSYPGERGAIGMPEGKGAVLIRQASSEGAVSFKGDQNRYHGLDNYWVVPDASQAQSLSLQFENEDQLEVTPWADPKPLTRLEKQEIREAFRVNPLLASLRPKVKGKPSRGNLIGAEKALAFSYVDAPLPPVDKGNAPSGRELIVDPGKRDPKNLIYNTLRLAIADALPGDVILLRHEGELKLQPFVLTGKDPVDLTLRAAKDHHPILVLDTNNVDSALFTLPAGKLRLEGLEFRLKPGRDFDSQAIVSFDGGGACEIKDCLITLDRSRDRKPTLVLAVAVLAKPSKRMKPLDDAPEQGPRLVLENSFVRGQGDLVWSQAGQPADVTVTESLIALTGSFLNVEGGKEKELPVPTTPLTVRLRKVTTLLGGHLIRLRTGKDLNRVANIDCEPDKCLFLPLGTDRALVHLEAPENAERGLKEKFGWRTTTSNAYGSFSTLLEQQALGMMMNMAQPASLADWKRDYDGDSQYNVKLTNLLAADTLVLSQFQPSAIRTPEKLNEYGAEVSKLQTLLREPKKKQPAPVTDFDLDDLP